MSVRSGIKFLTRIFTPAWSRSGSERVLDILLEALAEIDELYLLEHPETPRLYESGVRYYHYAAEEEWLDIPEAMHERIADCKSLSTWLVAEYRVSGIDPGARCTKKFALRPDGVLLYHILVQRSDGRTEDPSRELGMNQPEPDGYKPVPGVPWTVSNGMTSMIGAAILGSPEANGQFQALCHRARKGDSRARYLIDVAGMILRSNYDPTRRRWARQADGSWGWVH